MILCITPNAAVDRTLVVPGYTAGGVFRPQRALAAAGGKGINVARAVQVLGGEPLCGGFLAGHVGRFIADKLRQEGLQSRWTMLDSGESRTCVIIVDPNTGDNLVVNEAGMQVTGADWQRLAADVLAAAEAVSTICISGSVPPGSPLEALVSLLSKLRQTGKSIWVDMSGAALAAAVTVPGIHLKINDEEAAALLDTPVTTPAEAAQAGAMLQTRIGNLVVLTMGAAGAVMVGEAGAWLATPPDVQATSAVGSGDSFLAGMVVGLEQGVSLPDALARGVAAGTANALAVGGASFDHQTFEQLLSQVQVRTLA